MGAVDYVQWISRDGGEGEMIKSDASLALTPEQVRMVEENHNLIYGFMHKNNLCEEMYSIAAIGLCRAAATFDKDNGAAFSSYAYVCMFNECRNAWRIEKKQQALNQVSMEEAIKEAENLCIGDSISSRDSIKTAETVEFFAWFIKDASSKDLLIILRLIQGCSHVEIAKEMGYTKSYIGARLKSIREEYRSGRSLHRRGPVDAEREQRLKQEILDTIRYGWD